MNGFFKPLRRKIGVMTLLMACVFMGGWVRSELLFDQINMDHGDLQIRFGTLDGMLFILIATPQYERVSNTPMEWRSGKLSTIFPDGPRKPYDPWRVYDVAWRRDWAGFHFGEGDTPMRMMIREHLSSYYIPYWSIVIPLTLLSAFLLLSKPRSKLPIATTSQ